MDETLDKMKTTSCKKVKKLLSSYAEGLLNPDWKEQVKDHLALCPDCQEAYLKTQEILGLLKRDRLPDPGAEFWEKMRSGVMSQVRQTRPEPVKIPWTKRIWGAPFGWPGYAWATALMLILLTPVLIYTIHFNNPVPSTRQEIPANDWGGEGGMESSPSILETLSPKESIHLGKKMMARLAGDWPRQTPLTVEDELHGDISPSLEGLDKDELEILIRKMQPAGATGLWEDRGYVT
jgi:hypothetical protein